MIYPFARGREPLNPHQGRSAGFTMKSFKGSSNKCSPLRIPHQPARSLPPGVTNKKIMKPKCTPLACHGIKPIEAPLALFDKLL